MLRDLESRRGSRITCERWTALACLALGSGCVLAAVDDKAGDDGNAADDAASASWGSGDSGSGGSEAGPGGEASGGSDEGATNPPDDCVDIETAALATLETNCGGCHNPDANTAGFGFVTDKDKLIISGKIVPGDAEGSPLFQRIAAGEMPPAAAPVRPTEDEIAVIGNWIDSCLSGEPSGCAGQEWITTAQMVDAMLEDMLALPVTDRAFTRYLTLTHLHNIGYCEDDLEPYRFALTKAINSFSLDPQLGKPIAIDELGTIYRIDLRDYDWESTQGIDKWELLVDANPYAIELIDDDARVLQDFAGSDVPFMSADWLVFAGSQPPLYYDLVEIPATLQELEVDLGIDIEQNILDFEVDRAGFLLSGVSQNNRVFERHQLPGGAGQALWLSYDFASGVGAQNIFANPLDFQPNGGEGIYNLPNGMQAYFIVTAEGIRLDEAPIEIVTDPLQEDKLVRAGISCMSCHDEGTKLQDDELRDYVLESLDFDDATKEIVEQLHPPTSEMTSLLEQSAAVFDDAVAEVWSGPVGNVEPIILVSAAFDEDVDVVRAAAELGVSKDSLLSQLGGLDPQLAPLATGYVRRETWANAFADTVCALNLGLAESALCGVEE